MTHRRTLISMSISTVPGIANVTDTGIGVGVTRMIEKRTNEANASETGITNGRKVKVVIQQLRAVPAGNQELAEDTVINSPRLSHEA